MRVSVDGSGNITGSDNQLGAGSVVEFPGNPSQYPGFPVGYTVTGTAPNRKLTAAAQTAGTGKIGSTSTEDVAAEIVTTTPVDQATQAELDAVSAAETAALAAHNTNAGAHGNLPYASVGPAPSGDTSGVTDLASITAALLAASTAGGGSIYLPHPGPYYVSSGFGLYNSVHLYGLGAGRTSSLGHGVGTVIEAASSTATAKATFTATTNSTTTLSSITSFANLDRGIPVTGTNIPAGTYIVSINSGAGTAVMSAAATDSVAGKTITPWGPLIDVKNTVYAGVHGLTLTAPPGLSATTNAIMGISDFGDNTKSASLCRIEDVYFNRLGGSCVGLYGNVNTIQRIRADNTGSHLVYLRNSGNAGTGSDNFVHDLESGFGEGSGSGSGCPGDGLLIEGGSNNTVGPAHLYNHRYGWHIIDGVKNRLTSMRTEKNDLSGWYIEGTSTGNICTVLDSFNNGVLGSGATSTGGTLTGSGVARNWIQTKSSNDPTSALQAHGFTADTATNTTLSNVSSFVGIANDRQVVGAGIAAGTYIVSFNSGAGTITLNQATTATASGVALAVCVQDIGVNIASSATRNRVHADVYNVNVTAVRIDTSSYNRVWLDCDQIGQSAVTINGNSNHVTHLNAYQCGQRVTNTYDAVTVNAGDSNRIENFDIQSNGAPLPRYAINFAAGTTSNIARDGQAGSMGTARFNDATTTNGNKVRNFAGYLNSAPVVAVPATTVAIAQYTADRYFYVTAGATSCTVAVSSGPTVTVPAAHCVMVFCPAGATLTPTYTDAPTWVVHAVGN